MHQLIYQAIFCALVLLYTAPAIADTAVAKVQPVTSVTKQNTTTDWKQANQKVAELGGWQFYATEAGGHQTMDHSQHSSGSAIDHSKHKMPMDHSKHDSDGTMDHSKHSSDGTTDHSKHKMPVDHSKHQKVKTGDEHEHHH